MRGLKLSEPVDAKSAPLSHLLQMRGLKRSTRCRSFGIFRVASFTDAWIETLYPFTFDNRRAVASFTDAWIETFVPKELPYKTAVASFTDAWIETVTRQYCEKSTTSHLLQMRGLKP